MPFARFMLSLAVLVVPSLAFGQSAGATAATPELALKGYDPVTYFTDRRPSRGGQNYTYDWQGQRYQFATKQNRDAFTASPERYAPQFRGFSAAEISSGSRIAGDPNVFLVRDNKLYVFSTTDVRDVAIRNPVLLDRAQEEWVKK